jgi:glycosyltransferase involved in cell wall biosynthesis
METLGSSGAGLKGSTASPANLKCALVHVPYQQKGGEDRHFADLRGVYREAGINLADFPRSEGSLLTASLSSLGEGRRKVWDKWNQQNQPDIYHLHNIHPHFGPSFLRWLTERKHPAVWTIHNHRFYCTNGLAYLRGQICKDCKPAASLTRPIWRNCNDSLPKSTYHSAALSQLRGQGLLQNFHGKLLAPSAYMQEEMVGSGIARDRISLFPHFVQVPAFIERQPDIDLIFAGRLSKEKGTERLLALLEKFPEKCVAIVGDGPEAANFEAVARKNKNLLLHQGASREELFSLMSRSRVGLVPSECNESFSLFAAETLACGLQLIVARNESLAWYKEPPYDAIVADFSDQAGISEAINLAMRRSEAEDRAARAKKFAGIFSSVSYAERLRDLLKAVVAERKK